MKSQSEIDWLFLMLITSLTTKRIALNFKTEITYFYINLSHMNRKDDLMRMRPQILSAAIEKNTGNDERFQNLTLRPIIKLQQHLFIEVFKNYIVKHKNVFYDLTLEKRTDYIENAIHKDMKFRNSLKGMVIGHFTVDEYRTYIMNSSALNKRMMHLVKERLIDSIQIISEGKRLKAI